MAIFNKQENAIIYIIGAIVLMEIMDISILNTALPVISKEFGISPITLKIAITVYLLTTGLFISSASWFADKFGAKKVLLITLVGFITASVACGLSSGVITLILFRAIQGLFAAFSMPIARIIFVIKFKIKLTAAQSKMAIIVMIGSLLGPLLGGFFTSYISWRMIFFINLPIGIIVLYFAYKLLPDIKKTDKVRKFDIFGFIVLGLSISTLLLFLDVLSEVEISYFIKLGCIFFSFTMYILYIKHAKKLKESAIINIGIFKNKIFSFYLSISLMYRIFIMGIGFLMPLYFQLLLGYTAFQSGLMIVPMILGTIISKFHTTRLVKKLHFQKALTLSFIFSSISYFILAYVCYDFHLISYITISFIAGYFTSMCFVICNVVIYKSLPDSDLGQGTTINTTTFQIGASLSIAFTAIMLIGFSTGNNPFLESNSHNLISTPFIWVFLINGFGLLALGMYLFFINDKTKDIPL